MSFKKVIGYRGFWKSVFFMGILFILLYNVIVMFFDYGSLDFSKFYQDKILDGKWVKLLLASLISGFIYGFVVAYGMFQTRLKKEGQQE